jgi:hypothetical protein
MYRINCKEFKEKDLTIETKLKIWDQVIKDNLFVICKTPMAKLITRRTLLGYRNGKFNMHAFDDIIMQIKDKPEKLVDKISSKTFWGKEGTGKMKFNAVVGNPPYQISKGGTKNIDIWQHFVFTATKISEHSSLIHPGRWLVPKKQMKPIHDNILNSGLISFDYYPNSSQIFKGVEIDGGLTITQFRENYNGKITYIREGNTIGEYKIGEKFLSNEYEEEIFKLLNPSLFGGKNMSSRIIGNIGSLGGGEFGYKKSKHLEFLKESEDGMKNPLRIWANKGYGKGERFSWHFIDSASLDSIPKNLLLTRKVMIDKKGHAITSGKGNVMNNKPQIVDILSIASGDVLFVMPENDLDYDLKLIRSLFLTKTARFLMTITQKDLYVRGFENIPDYTYFIPLLDGKLFSDKFFYDNFNFSEGLIEHIEKNITPK